MVAKIQETGIFSDYQFFIKDVSFHDIDVELKWDESMKEGR